MTILTAYNEKVQEYNEAPNKAYKKERLASLIDAVKSAGQVFERMFTFAKKQVLDRIIYLLSGSGICKVAGAKLASKCGVSIRTVRAAVSAIKKTGQFEIGRIANEQAGKYIFVDKAHPNYEWLMHDVFSVDIASLNAHQDARLENAESLVPVSTNDEKTPLNGFNSFNLLKQANKNNNILECADSNQTETGGKEKSEEQERKSLQEFAEPAQIEFYDAVKADPSIKDEIKAEAYTMALAIGEAERIDTELAMEKVRHINADTDTHLRIDTTIRATFIASYNEALTYKPVKEAYQAPAFLNYDWMKKKTKISAEALAYDWC